MQRAIFSFPARKSLVESIDEVDINRAERDDSARILSESIQTIEGIPYTVVQGVASGADGEQMEVKFLEDDSDYPAVLEVLLQLRTGYDADSLSEQIKKQESKGYRVVYVKSPEGILAVAGFVAGEKLAWGKHIYIDDLVTSACHRSSGVGEFLISWFKDYAREIGCEQIHLDSGVQRFPAHKFYLREGFNIASHHFSIVDLQGPSERR